VHLHLANQKTIA